MIHPKMRAGTVEPWAQNPPPFPPKQGFEYVHTGIEVELERGGERYPNTDLWSIKGDPSLRNNGLELVSQVLRTPERLLEACAEYTGLRNTQPWEGNVRTSTHVHLDCRARTPEEVSRIIAMYCLVEPYLYTICRTREENIYCIPFYRAERDLFFWKQTLVTGAARTMLRNTCKYSGLFIGPLNTFGTIEFRMAPTWNEGTALHRWVKLCQDIYSTAVGMETAHLRDLCNHGGYEQIVRTIFSNYRQHLPNENAVMVDTIEEHGSDEIAASVLDPFFDPPKLRWSMMNMPAVPFGAATRILGTKRTLVRDDGPNFRHEDLARAAMRLREMVTVEEEQDYLHRDPEPEDEWDRDYDDEHEEEGEQV